MQVDVYVKLTDVLNNMEHGGLLVGNNLEWAREAALKADAVNINRYVEGAFLLRIFEELSDKVDEYKHKGKDGCACAEGIIQAISRIAKAVYDKTGNTDFQIEVI